MSCSCIKGTDSRFDFKIEFIDCETIAFTDLSTWMDDENYSIPEKHEVTVNQPVSDKEIIVEIKPQGTTILKGDDLKTSKCIPDGVYCFTIDSCGIKYKRSVALTCLIECRLEKISYLLSKKEIDINKVIEFNNYLGAIKAAARDGQPKKAAEFYQILNNQLDNFDCECSCK